MTTAAVGVLAAALVTGTAFAGATAAAAAKSSSQPSSAVRIGTAKVSGLGTVLVRGAGHPLYVFQATSTSIPGCAACKKIWFPLIAPATGVAKAVGGAKQSLIGSVKDPVNGKRVVTYDGWPLYTYVLDRVPDIANGQGILMGGGYWRVLTPAGKVNRTSVTHGGGYVGS